MNARIILCIFGLILAVITAVTVQSVVASTMHNVDCKLQTVQTTTNPTSCN